MPTSGSASTTWRHLPNAITLARIVLVLPVALMLLERRFGTALWLIGVAGASDAVDGWLARHFAWRSHLGGMLDPLADKLLLVTCVLALTHVGAVPLALALLVLGRDAVIVLGALAYRWLVGPFTASPTWISKCCTAVQVFYVLAVVLKLSAWPALMVGPLRWAVVVATLASGVDYVVRWTLRARAEWRARANGGKENRHES